MEKKFYQLSPKERLAQLSLEGKLTPDMLQALQQTALSEEVANHLIENQISDVSIPLGVVRHFKVNQKDYVIPLATEEPSVVAACSNGAKMVAQSEGFTSSMHRKELRGQIVFMNVQAADTLVETIEANKAAIFQRANESYPSIVQRGGGLTEVQIRRFVENPMFLSVDFIVDTKDAMGANIMNTILEGTANLFREWFDKTILFSILSNYATESLVTATCRVPFSALSKGGDGEEVAMKIAAASTFAQLDPYRATTHNKGVMNGIDALVLATGNDTRAMAAAAHAYASRDGQYRGLSQWTVTADGLRGEITLPVTIGTVGGATRVLPKAQAALALLQVSSAKELAEVIAAVGLAQNLAALRALVTEGIQKGHMSLQARSLALSVGAKGEEVTAVATSLKKGVMNEQRAIAILAALRSE